MQIPNSKFLISNSRLGYAGLTMTMLVMVVSLTVVGTFTFFTFHEVSATRVFIKSIESRYVSEGGIEDAVYRILSGKQIGSSETLGVGNGTTTITITSVGNKKTIRSEGRRDAFQQNFEMEIKILVEAVNFNYGVQIGEGGLEMDNNSQVTGSIASNGSIIGAAGAAITGDTIVAAGLTANPTLQWSTHNADYFFATASSNRDIAQSFTATASDKLNKVSMYLGKVGNPSDITLRIAADDSNKPDDSDIANVIIPASSVGATPSWIDASLSPAPTLTNGNKYWIVLDYGSQSASNHWNWRKDTSDGYANNTGKYTSNWNSNNANWTNVGGDLAFRVWIGGVNNKIDTVTIGSATTSSAWADLFINTSVHGSACPNQYCIDNDPQPQIPMPLSDGIIQDFKNEATAGGTITGDYSVTSNTSMGPKKITGNLILNSNNKILTVTGTIYVEGYIDISNGSTITCSPSYGDNSCVVLSDGWIHVQNNSVFSGSGQTGSFIMLLSTLACDGTNENSPCGVPHHHGAIDLHNNAIGAIFYASRGLITLHNGVAVTEITAYKLHLNQNANVVYNQGLQNTKFTSGPAGGYDVESWREVE